MSSPTIVFGLDGACFELIEDWIGDGRLPTLQAIGDGGIQSGLKSCTPATTPPAWSSLTTGVNPGKHGVFGFYRRISSSYDIAPVSDQDVHARRLWDYTTEHDVTALVINVPVTHPGRALDGAIVPGYLSPDTPETYPADLLGTVGMDEYRVYAESESDDVPESQLLDEWLDLTASRRDLALGLMAEYDWDMLFVEFQKTDGAVHKFDERANIRRIYECVDGCMADILDATQADPNVFVVSDHGIGQPKEWSVALNTWLVEQEYATTTIGTSEKPSWRDTETAETDTRGLLARLLALAGTVGLTKQQLERLLTTVGLYNVATKLVPKDATAGVNEEVIDNRHSTAFYQGIGFSGVDVGVMLNTASFYDDGIVSESEYETLRSELMAELRDLTGPDGSRAFTSVKPREDVYEGPYVQQAPDIILRQAPDYVIGSSKPRGKTFIPADAGRIDHTDTGLLLATGPDISDEWTPETEPSIVDIVPSLLHLHDIPLNERFDGKPLDFLATDRQPTWKPYEPYSPTGATEFSSEEERALEDRLKGMGYLE